MEGGIMININSGVKTKWKKPKQADIKTPGERIDAPSSNVIFGKVKKKRKEMEGTEDSVSKPCPAKKVKRDEVGAAGVRSKKSSIGSGTIISSLFKSNPRQPHISRLKVEPNTEEMFGSQTFDDLALHPFMVSNLESSTFSATKLTTVQQRSIPPILKGDDVLVKSQTGSGKTLAYAVPIIQVLQEMRPKIQRSDGIYALVVVPTRELAIQTFDWFQKLVKPFSWIVPGCMTGGEKKKSEKARIRKGINVLVTTPGRLLDHVRTTVVLSLKRVRWLILDEADRLLDLGYEKDISDILESLNQQLEGKRQTVMLSATLSQGLERLAGLALNEPTVIDVANNETLEGKDGKADGETFARGALERTVMPENLHQFFVVVPTKLRLVSLAAFILWKCKCTDENKLLVFFPTQDMVDFHDKLLTRTLKRTLNTDDMDANIFDADDNEATSSDNDEDDDAAVNIFRLHGNMDQKERKEVFCKFRDADRGLLLCTDVASRGLDLPQVNWIVQYSAPATTSDYVHRVGRTARIGSRGSSLIFLLPSEALFVSVLEQEDISLQELRVDRILESLTLHTAGGGRRRSTNTNIRRIRGVEEAATAVQLKFENILLTDRDLIELARKAYLSYIRSYASYPVATRYVFQFKELHLGHVAKSLALRETPRAMGANAGAEGKRRQNWNRKK